MAAKPDLETEEEREDRRTYLGQLLISEMLQDNVREMQLEFPFGPLSVTLIARVEIAPRDAEIGDGVGA